MHTPTFGRNKDRNELQACEAHGCGHLRHHLNRWCEAHTRQAKRYGHPSARPLRPALWSPERNAVRELLSANEDHSGVQSVVGLLGSWSAQATSNERAFRGAEEVARLARHGVKPLDMLVEVAACWLWLARNPNAVPSDRAADFAISRAVLALAPRPRRVTRGPGGSWPVTVKVPANRSYAPKARPSALAYIGPHLRAVLAPLLANILQHLEAEEAQRRAHEAALSAPFKFPSRL